MSDSSSKDEPLYLHVSDPPYENHFFCDSAVSCQCVLASPLPSTNGGPPATHRLLFAWPAGNSGATVFFKVPEGSAITSSIKLRVGQNGRVLKPFKLDPDLASPSSCPSLGVSGILEFTHTAGLDLAILGSLRTIRDFTEGNGILNPHVQDAIRINKLHGKHNGISISRALFDGKTTICLTLASIDNNSENIALNGAKNDSDSWATFAPGVYSFEAHVNYAQIHSILPKQLLKPAFDRLISSQPDAVRSLSFMCSSDKILAGAWRFLTYFGRDSMISLLLLMPILREGENGPIEIGLSAVLERIDSMSGSVCHEENIGDYPAAQAALNGSSNSDAEFDYKMVDTDFFLPILAKQYFMESSVGQERLPSFLRTSATMIPANAGKTYRDLLARTCQKILDLAWPFAKPHGHVSYKNLIALKAGVPVGQWRDSNDGLGGGRYPYDVNTGLMPAALHAIADLAECGTFPDQRWGPIARERAKVWEHQAPLLFIGNIPQKDAERRLEEYKQRIAFPGASAVDQVKSDMCVHALALNGDGSLVEIMHTDACFRLLLLPHLILSEHKHFVTQHLRTLEQVAWSILTTFPAGLSTPAGIVIANPAYSTNPSHAHQFTTGAYHGTVIWAWNSLIMLTKALEVQLSAVAQTEESGLDPVTRKTVDSESYKMVIDQVKRAYTHMWELIEANREHLSAEVWSWRWNENAKAGKGDFAYVPLSHLPTPDGAGQTESNARQLWSLTFLALQRKGELER